ncbi:MAG: protein phosphatase 2C domain-containing protein [Gemmataceae bacterium]|nr:protein phosphatase 2C domain-containing protein [Gemmataceae bacterium]
MAGSSHRRTGQPCEDANCWQIADGVLIASVADGAGSAVNSSMGANQAVSKAVEAAIDWLRSQGVPGCAGTWDKLLRRAFGRVRKELEGLAEIMETSPQEFATTLLLAVVADGWLAVAQVGDGAVVVRASDDTFRAVTRPPVGVYINETSFLTSVNGMERAQIVVEETPITGLAMLTDGLQMLGLRMPQGAPHPAFFSPLLRLLAAGPNGDGATDKLRGFLESPQVMQRAQDDLTLVLAVREVVGEST